METSSYYFFYLEPAMFSSPISQDEINNILRKACDTFRGTVDPSEYKNYILVMLFLKYVSDVCPSLTSC